MRVIDCECGTTLKAANDDELADQVREHLESAHDDTGKSGDELRGFVEKNAYEATDA
jgi:predicted small metal-binding protein